MPPVRSDRTNVTGTATLGDATVNAFFAAGANLAKQYTILNAAGGISGTFAGPVNTNLPANFHTSLSYDANNAYLNLLLNFTPPGPPRFGGGLNVNQQNVGNALINFFNTTGGIPLVPDKGIACWGVLATPTLIKSRLPTMPFVGSNSTQPDPGT